MSTQHGTIAQLDVSFGFIQPRGRRGRVFFLADVVADTTFADLRRGQRVEFEMDDVTDLRGPRASRVVVAGCGYRSKQDI